MIDTEKSKEDLIAELDSLRASERRYRTFVNSSPSGVWETNADGVTIFCNPMLAVMFGTSEQEMIGNPYLEYVFEEDFQQAQEIFSALIQGNLKKFEFRFKRKDGEPIWTELSIMQLSGYGQISGAFAIVSDISHRKRVEDALRESEQRYARVIQGTSDGIWEINVVTGDGYISPRWKELLGFTGDELPHHADSFFSRIHPDDLPHVQLAYQAHLEKHVPYETELRLLTKSGDYCWFLSRGQAEWDDQGQPVRMSGSISDISARKLMEKALFEAGTLQRAIFNSANFSSIATDAKGVIQIFNVGAECMLGYSAAEVMNKLTPADVSDPHEVIARAAALTEELDTPIAPGFEALVFKASRGIEDIYELTYIRKDGSRFPAVVSVTALRDDQDAIIGYLLIGTDNTEHKQVEDSKRRLEQLKEDVERITKHDLKTPLNGIINIPILLLDDDNLTLNQRRLLSLIELSGHKMLQQLNSALELYKIETDAYIMTPIEFDPVKLVQDSIDMLTIGLQFDPAGIALQVNADKSYDSGRSIKTDRLLLDVIIMNLLRNAMESSDKDAQVFVDISQGKKTFIIAISNGRSVPEEIRDRFFEKYVTAGKSGGTGLGTYSAAMMTRALGGAISMETSDETGTKVTVRIPIVA